MGGTGHYVMGGTGHYVMGGTGHYTAKIIVVVIV